MVLIVVGLAVALVAVGALLVLSHLRAVAERSRFAAIVDVDAEVLRLRAAAIDEIARLKATAAGEISTAMQEAERTKAGVRQQAAQHDQLLAQANRVRDELSTLGAELRSVEGSLEDISFGLYKPQYNFDTPEQFKQEMERVFDRQKAMVRDGKAASFAVSWTINGNTREGERMQKQYTKLILREFNGECDAAIAKVTWNSASKMEERIRKAFVAINKLGEGMSISLSAGYRDLRLAELRLEYELAEKKKEIADEQRRIREQMKDEQRALQEAERAQVDAEAEEARFQKALERAKVELAKARGEDHNRLSAKIDQLQEQLLDARARSVRAKSLAEMTKAGYVYVISNIGSFVENVFKIGMTRRLEPMDRVRELGSASVPFPFDVHAMVYDDCHHRSSRLEPEWQRGWSRLAMHREPISRRRRPSSSRASRRRLARQRGEVCQSASYTPHDRAWST